MELLLDGGPPLCKISVGEAAAPCEAGRCVGVAVLGFNIRKETGGAPLMPPFFKRTLPDPKALFGEMPLPLGAVLGLSRLSSRIKGTAGDGAI